MDLSLSTQIAQLSADTTSGASELLPRAIEILRAAVRLPPDSVLDAVRAVGRAQPSMASLWNAALVALRERRTPGSLDRFDVHQRRAPNALVRCALDQLLTPGIERLHVVTVSFSGSMLACLLAAARQVRLRVSCAEGRPGLEGRRLASMLVEAGVPVDFYLDAALGEALQEGGPSDAVVLVGADAITPAWILNKTGTSMLAAAASRIGIPFYVAATRDKFMDARVARLLRVVEHDPRIVWDDAPAGVRVRNAWFEKVPADLLSGIITDTGTLLPGMLEEACRAASAEIDDNEIEALSADAQG